MIKLEEFNGHIRNWEALCSEIGLDKSLSREEREREILTKGYEKWGKELPKHLYGHFAFVLKDDEAGELYLARDPFGTKLLYYYVTEDNSLLFGTQIRNFIDDPKFKKELNRDALQIYLTTTYMIGEDTFFKGVKKIMPGTYAVFKEGKLDVTKYYEIEFTKEDKPIEEYANEIHETVKQMFREVKTADEEVTSFLSGGVDSSYVLAMSDVKEASCCGYEEEKFDESPLALETANKLNRKFNKCTITPERYFETIPYTLYNMEQPLGDASAIAFSIGCIETAKKYKICYSGEGADEFFGGYNMYRNAERYGDNLKTFYVGNTMLMKEEEKKELLTEYKEGYTPISIVEHLYDKMEGYDPLSKMSSIDVQVWLDGDIYLNVDKMSRAAGLEIRMPLSDARIFDIARRMPSNYKVTEEENKVAFRMAASNVLPEEIAHRKKLGFVVPIRLWLADERYNGDVREKLFSSYSKEFFKEEEVKKIYDEYIGGNSDLWRKVYTIYAFLVWYDEYFNKR